MVSFAARPDFEKTVQGFGKTSHGFETPIRDLAEAVPGLGSTAGELEEGRPIHPGQDCRDRWCPESELNPMTIGIEATSAGTWLRRLHSPGQRIQDFIEIAAQGVKG